MIVALVPKFTSPIEAFPYRFTLSPATGTVGERIHRLQQLFPHNSFFSTTRLSCGHTAGQTCDRCNFRNVLPALGYTIPPSSPSSGQGTVQESWTCVAFVRFAYFFVFNQHWDANGQSGIPSNGTVVTNPDNALPGDIFIWSAPINHWGMYIGRDSLNRRLFIHSNYGGTNRVAISDYESGTTKTLRHIVRANNRGTVDTFPSGTYYIRNVHSGKYMDVPNAAPNGSHIIQHRFNGAVNQRWQVTHLTAGVFHIRPSYSSTLRLMHDTPWSGTIRAANTTAQTNWRIIYAQNGAHKIESATDTAEKRVVTVRDASVQCNALCILYEYQPWTTPNDEWVFERTSNTSLINRTVNANQTSNIFNNRYFLAGNSISVTYEYFGNASVILEIVNSSGSVIWSRQRPNGVDTINYTWTALTPGNYTVRIRNTSSGNSVEILGNSIFQ
jgi:hypothetical protein